MAEILTPEQISVLAQQIKELLAKGSQGVGEVPVVASLDYVFSLPTIEKKGEDEKVVEVPLTLLRISLRRGPDAIEWRQGDTGNWQSLIPIPEISGLTPVFRNGDTGIEWKYTTQSDSEWKTLVSYDVLKLKFSDLTPIQVQTLWDSVPDAMITVFQKPATDKAVLLEEWKTTTQQTLDQVKKDVVTATEQARDVTIQTQEATQQAIKAKEDVIKATTDANLAISKANQAATEAIDKASLANTAANDANSAKEQANTAADRLNALSDHRDEIRDGYWWRWNEVTKEWYNTGEIAKGNVMFATFEVDPLTGRLTMFIDPEYANANFELDQNGKLQVII